MTFYFRVLSFLVLIFSMFMSGCGDSKSENPASNDIAKVASSNDLIGTYKRSVDGCSSATDNSQTMDSFQFIITEDHIKEIHNPIGDCVISIDYKISKLNDTQLSVEFQSFSTVSGDCSGSVDGLSSIDYVYVKTGKVFKLSYSGIAGGFCRAFIKQ